MRPNERETRRNNERRTDPFAIFEILGGILCGGLVRTGRAGGSDSSSDPRLAGSDGAGGCNRGMGDWWHCVFLGNLRVRKTFEEDTLVLVPKRCF